MMSVRVGGEGSGGLGHFRESYCRPCDCFLCFYSCICIYYFCELNQDECITQRIMHCSSRIYHELHSTTDVSNRENIENPFQLPFFHWRFCDSTKPVKMPILFHEVNLISNISLKT